MMTNWGLTEDCYSSGRATSASDLKSTALQTSAKQALETEKKCCFEFLSISEPFTTATALDVPSMKLTWQLSMELQKCPSKMDQKMYINNRSENEPKLHQSSSLQKCWPPPLSSRRTEYSEAPVATPGRVQPQLVVWPRDWQIVKLKFRQWPWQWYSSNTHNNGK